MGIARAIWPWVAILSAAPDDPAPTAGEGVASGVFRFRILDEDGRPMPGRLTFLGERGPGANLFPNVKARPSDLAVRFDVVYTLSGEGAITVPPGRYEVFASRGIEWSLGRTEVVLEKGREVEWTARLRREVDTRGSVSGDFHLHTLTYSGHGDADLEERIVSLVGEGVEFAVATDHNHHTDYGPAIESLGARSRVTAVTGNEVSTPVGHFNAFPLDPKRRPVDAKLRDANALFRLIRDETNAFGVVPVIQLNHPRWGEIDYFGLAGLDPVTGTSDRAAYSADFDTLEVFNENAGWGYEEADTADFEVGSSVHSVLEDWFNLLNRGHRYAAVGNSDSHTVHYAFAGYPRNFVPSGTDDPGAIDPSEVAAALRARRVFTTFGPFVEFSVNGAAMGGGVAARDGEVEIEVRVQAASWIDCDRVLVVANGEVVEEIAVPPSRGRVRLETRRRLRLARDAWIALRVEGDDSLAPILTERHRAARPFAVANPVWVDADGDGAFTPLADWAKRAWASADGEARDRSWREGTPTERKHLLFAAVEAADPGAAHWIRRGLADPDRRVALAAARAAERLADRGFVQALEGAWNEGPSDAYARIALLRALRACGVGDLEDRLFAVVEGGARRSRRYLDELEPLVPGRFVRDWLAIGYFPPGTSRLDDEPSLAHVGKEGEEVCWAPRSAGERGFLDLRGLHAEAKRSERAVAFAQTWLRAPEAGAYAYTLGTDDGTRLWVNGDLVHEDRDRRGAHPLQRVGRLELREGWNHALFAVENATGSFGLYFRLLDERVDSTAEPPATPSEPPSPREPSDPDRDGDGLSDFQERHKYFTDPDSPDSDGDGIPDGDWDERCEFAYTVRTVVQVLPPVTPDVLCDDYQDARILEARDEYVELEVIHYPLNKVADGIAGDPDWREKAAALCEYLEPGLTANWDSEMRDELQAALREAGIEVESLDDAALVRRASKFLLDRARFEDGFTTFYAHFPQGRAAVYPGLDEAVERERAKQSLSLEEQWERELFAKGMFRKGVRGSCTSTAIYLNGCLRALGIPTRIVLCIPVVDSSDEREVELVRRRITHPGVRRIVSKAIERLGDSWSSHTFNEVFVGGRWRRLNYSRLGQGILDEDLFGLMTHVATFRDWADGEMAKTWGTRQANGRHGEDVFGGSNPYSTVSLSDRFGEHAEIDPGLLLDPDEFRALTIERLYGWHSPERRVEMRLDDPETAGHLLAHVRESRPGEGTGQYRGFYESVGKRFALRAEGHPDVPVLAARGYWVDGEKGIREFYLRIEPEDLPRMAYGVPYRQVPLHEGETFRWEVAEGATIAREAVEVRRKRIESVVWSDDPDLEPWIRDSFGDGPPVLLARVAEWEGFEDLKAFTASADSRFYLEAEGRPRLEIVAGVGGVANESGSIRFVVLPLGSSDWRDLAPGVPYALSPRNGVPGYRWEAAEGVAVPARTEARR